MNFGAFLDSEVKNLPSMQDTDGLLLQETQVKTLGGKESLKKEMAIRSTVLDWRIPWTQETHGLQFMGSQELHMT